MGSEMCIRDRALDVPEDSGCISAIAAVPGIPPQEMAAAQKSSAESIKTAFQDSSLSLELLPQDGFSLLCETGFSPPRVVVPESMVERVISSVHSLAHPATRPTLREVARLFV